METLERQFIVKAYKRPSEPLRICFEISAIDPNSTNGATEVVMYRDSAWLDTESSLDMAHIALDAFFRALPVDAERDKMLYEQDRLAQKEVGQ